MITYAFILYAVMRSTDRYYANVVYETFSVEKMLRIQVYDTLNLNRCTTPVPTGMLSVYRYKYQCE
jgi:hypothetical protein